MSQSRSGLKKSGPSLPGAEMSLFHRSQGRFGRHRAAEQTSFIFRLSFGRESALAVFRMRNRKQFLRKVLTEQFKFVGPNANCPEPQNTDSQVERRRARETR